MNKRCWLYAALKIPEFVEQSYNSDFSLADFFGKKCSAGRFHQV